MIHAESSFRGAGGLDLFRQAWRPDNSPPLGLLINVHGIGDHSGLYPMLPDYFVPRGWAVHAFDLRGNGRSPGRRGHIAHWSDLREDLARFLAEVRRDDPSHPLFLLGHSLGGLIVLDFVLHHPVDLHGVIAASPPLGRVGTPDWLLALGRAVSHLWPTFTLETGLDLAGLSRDPAARDAIVSDPLFHRRGSARMAAELLATARRLRREASRLGVPVLLLHGRADRMCLPDGTRAFYDALGSIDKTYIEYPEGYHALLADLDRDLVLRDIARWMDARRG